MMRNAEELTRIQMAGDEAEKVVGDTNRAAGGKIVGIEESR